MWTMREAWRFVKNPTEELQLKIRTNGFVIDGSAREIFVSGIKDGELRDADLRYHRYARWLCRLIRLPQTYAPWLAMGIMKNWQNDAEMLNHDELCCLAIRTYGEWLDSRYVTCPGCERTNRSLTSKGRMRLHNISINRGNPGYRKPCPMSGEVYVRDEVLR